MTKSHAQSTVGFLGVLLFGSQAAAGDLPQRIAFEATSRTSVVGRASVKTIHRGDSRQPDTVMSALLRGTAGISLGSNTTMQTTPRGSIRVVGEQGAYVEVNANGSAGEYYQPAPKLDGIDPSARLSDDALIHAAQSYVKDELADGLGLQIGELYPLRIRHKVGSTYYRNTPKVTQQLLSSEVVFGRIVDGVPVIGPGSKIWIELSASGVLVNYRFDWSKLTVGTDGRDVAPVMDVVERARKYMGLSIASATDFTRFECGYFDQGEQSTGALQTACLVETQIQGPGSGRVPIAEYVPAAKVVDAEAGWPLSRLVNGLTVESQSSPPPELPMAR